MSLCGLFFVEWLSASKNALSKIILNAPRNLSQASVASIRQISLCKSCQTIFAHSSYVKVWPYNIYQMAKCGNFRAERCTFSLQPQQTGMTADRRLDCTDLKLSSLHCMHYAALQASCTFSTSFCCNPSNSRMFTIKRKQVAE